MANITATLNEHIRRLARRELHGNMLAVKRATSQYRRDIAALKREVSKLSRDLNYLRKQEKRRVNEAPAERETQGMRFRADGVRSHRSRLGLSAMDYGKLVGVSGLTIYHWEGGKVRPRQSQLAKLAAIRGLGKREAMNRLALLDGKGKGKASAA